MSYKIGSICAVYGCSNYKQQKESKSFYRMPKEKDLLKKWIVACKRKDLDELLQIKEIYYFYKSYVVCSDHFEMQCFRNKNLLSQGLLPGSVPTLLLYNVLNKPKRKIRSEILFNDNPKKKKKVMSFEDGLTFETSSNEASTSTSTSNLIETEIETLRQENAKLKLAAEQYKKGGNNVTPDSVKFRCNLRSIMANQLLQPSADSNSEVDACNFLLQKQEIFKKTLSIPVQSPRTGSFEVNLNYNLAEKNSECYVLGWVCSRLPHEKCRNELCTLNNNYDIVNTQIELKKYTESSRLYFPNEIAKKTSDNINLIFKNNIDVYLNESVVNVKAKLINCISIKENMGNVCSDCCTLFLDKYFNVLIKAYINKRNDDNKAKLVKKMKCKNIKLKKISHNYIRIFI